MFRRDGGMLWGRKDEILGGRRLVWIYMMVRRGLESGRGSLLGLKRLVRLMVVEDGGCYGGNHDHVCIVFEHYVCRVSN